MTFSKFIPVSILALLTSATVSCAANSTEVKSTNANNYLKPGASITYSHDLKSQISSGDTVTFKLGLNEPYNKGQLNVSLIADGDIALFASSTQASFNMADEGPHEMTVSLTANSNGRHYINVQALAVNPSGQSQPRIFSIPVQVGPVIAQKPNENMKIMSNGEAIIEMQADEVIK